METLTLVRRTISYFMITQNRFNIKSFIKRLSNIGVGFANCALSTRSTKINFSTFCISYYPFKIACASQDHLTIYSVFNFLKKKISPFAIIEWCNLDISICNSKSLRKFRKSILQFIRPSRSSTYNGFNNKRTKHVTRLRLGLSHLHVHKFKHAFLGSVNPICRCGLDVEETYH